MVKSPEISSLVRGLIRVKSAAVGGAQLAVPNFWQRLQLQRVQLKVPSLAIGMLIVYLMALSKHQLDVEHGMIYLFSAYPQLQLPFTVVFSPLTCRLW